MGCRDVGLPTPGVQEAQGALFFYDAPLSALALLNVPTPQLTPLPTGGRGMSFVSGKDASSGAGF